MKTDEKDTARMLEICEECENVRIIEVPFIAKSMLQCKLCNCIMNAKVKVSDSPCPINKF